MGAHAVMWQMCDPITSVGWYLYENSDYHFAIAYPPAFLPVEPGDVLVAPGAAVTFAPTFDPAIDTNGAKTNLHEISVTVAVHDSSRKEAFDQSHHADAVCALFQTCEGAAGSRYETLGYRTIACGRVYEIVLFIHSGNPDCYPAGAIVPFDRDEFLELFDRMVRTFRLVFCL